MGRLVDDMGIEEDRGIEITNFVNKLGRSRVTNVKELIEKIHSNFKDRNERDLAIVYIGYLLGRTHEKEKQNFLVGG